MKASNELMKKAKNNNLDDGIYLTFHDFIKIKRLICIKNGRVISRDHSFFQSFFFEVNSIILKM